MSLWNLLFGSSENDDDKEVDDITIDYQNYSWTPDNGEKVFIAHENCQILTNGGKETYSFQYFICCVTNKRIVLVPMSKGLDKRVAKVVSSILDIGFAGSYFLKKELCDKYVNHPIYMDRKDIKKVELYEEIPSGQIILIETDCFQLLLGFPKMDYAFNIQKGFYYPQWFE